ncbi:MAG: hypothetical protein ACRYF7_23085 [Janthinobacterium lividum]
MDGQITSRSTHRARGAAAFDAGFSRDSHNLNPGSAAIVDWQHGYDTAAQAWHAKQQQARVAMEVSPP